MSLIIRHPSRHRKTLRATEAALQAWYPDTPLHAIQQLLARRGLRNYPLIRGGKPEPTPPGGAVGAAA